MSKITLSTKYLSKQNLFIGVMAGLLVVIFLAFQFTNVEMQSKETDIATAVEEASLTSSKFNWKSIDLTEKSIPDSIKIVVNNNDINAKTTTIKVFDKFS